MKKRESKIIPLEVIRNLSRDFEAMCGMMLKRIVRIVSIIGDDIGYTISKEGNIYVNFNHKIVSDLMLSIKQRTTFVLGVVTNELLHLLITSFSEMEAIEEGKKPSEQKIAHTLLNILEDARIEYFAPELLGRNMCRALLYSKKCVFKHSCPLNEIDEKRGYRQYVTALIQYGDGGTIKGHFTNKEAESIFYESVSSLDASMKCQTTEICSQYAQKLFELSRPLWEKEDSLDELFQWIRKEFGTDMSKTPSGGGKDGKPLIILSGTGHGAGKSLDHISDEEAEEIGSNEIEMAEAKSEDVSGNGKENVNTKLEVAEPGEGYENILYQVSTESRMLAHSLSRIFTSDREKEVYAKVGRYQPKREFGSRETSRVCTRRIAPSEKNDLAIMVLVDESGSMGCYDKYGRRQFEVAKSCAVMLAETAATLHTPIAVIGFDADREGYDVIHTKYLLWDNTSDKRKRLVNITHKLDNADGYSIRYASKLLAKRPEKHKLLIVISDGEPSAFIYKNAEAGIIDTKNAIQTAKKMGQIVCGILISDYDSEAHRKMYGRNLVYTEDGRVAHVLAQKLKQIIKEL